MANPNIVNVSTINGNTVTVGPIGTSGNTILSNSNGSGVVYKVGSIVIANYGASATAATVAFNNAADSGGSNTFIIYQVSVPTNASLIVTDKSTAFYLPENTSINVLSGTAASLHAVLSYEQIS